MLYITSKKLDEVKEYTNHENFLTIENAIYVIDKNDHHYTYLKNNTWLCMDYFFVTPYRPFFHFFFSKIQEIKGIEREAYTKLAEMEIPNIDKISFKNLYLETESGIVIPSKGIEKNI